MKKKISIKTKALLTSLASLALLGFIITLLGAIYVNSLKKIMVQEAISIAQTQGEHLLDEINTYLRKEHLQEISQLKDASGFKSQLELFVRGNDNIISARLLDAEGRVIITHYQDNRKIISKLAPSEEFRTMIGPLNPEKLELIIRSKPQEFTNVKLPIKHGDVAVGQLQYDIATNAVYRNLFSTSRIISTRLVIIVLVSFVILALTFFLLWRIFAHHIELVRAKDESDKMAYVGSLASGLAHEIRNPLNAMNVNLELVREKLQAEQREAQSASSTIIDAVQRDVTRLNKTLTDFLCYALPGRLEPEEVDLRDIVKESVALLEAEFSRRNVRCDINAPAACQARVDIAGLRQVISNILLNAAEAMDGVDNRIFVDVRSENNTCRISITDTGKGIASQDLDTIFEPFFSTKADGGGFGLAIARRIVEQHKGRIWAETAPTGGARINIILPRAA
jgi:signal transduction histidine kinase